MKLGGTRSNSRLLDGSCPPPSIEESKLFELLPPLKQCSSYQATDDKSTARKSQPYSFLEDASSLAMRKLSRSFLICFYIWILSFLLFETTIIWGVAFSQQYIRLMFRLRALAWLCAAIGNCYFLAEINKNIRLDLCNHMTSKNLITREQRETMSPSTLRQYLMDDSLPLLRRILCWSLLLFVLLILTLLSELSMVMYNLSEGAWIRRYTALSPIYFALFVIAVYSVCLKSIDILTCGCLFLLLIYSVLCGVTAGTSLTLAMVVFKTCLILIPTMVLVAHIYYVVRHYQCTATQRCSCVCYGLGALCIVLSVGINLLSTLEQRSIRMLENGVTRASNVLWVMAVVSFAAGGVPVVKDESERLAASRGYSEPRRLCRKEEGWTIMEAAHFPVGQPSNDVSPALGTLILTSSSSISTGNFLYSWEQPTRWSRWYTNINDTANTWRQRYQDWIRSESFLTLNCCSREERRTGGQSLTGSDGTTSGTNQL